MFQKLMSVFEAVCADLIGPFKKLVKYLRAIVEHAVSTDRPNGKDSTMPHYSMRAACYGQTVKTRVVQNP